ncbi:uncharacterized protein LOC143305317 isoform X1 [Osmia lignaria lignaria]|uniref:uncharacterized protein LOC143305317 isoform X1 n=1 Tax=Osmia lignaria lignaria TaxID=1437193 RepID=UPI00402BA753
MKSSEKAAIAIPRMRAHSPRMLRSLVGAVACRRLWWEHRAAQRSHFVDSTVLLNEYKVFATMGDSGNEISRIVWTNSEELANLIEMFAHLASILCDPGVRKDQRVRRRLSIRLEYGIWCHNAPRK